ncbi:hypothetical protein BBK36DRAFT_1169857 [Trichoderma citrinoviride]|uniref:Uncharacterized protein n=1 Tax=Trichoderma citrinoviride TaxID=58853 RepID=A0A2T4B790_9HYPO|nr:hypothetical protein BBK36DRAFT_1169857 [Trichoderma citrinoviride]PTB65081.1 hypothetical protein BBK36DRAFT_1169857 [Trichoderma citrinoviride]
MQISLEPVQTLRCHDPLVVEAGPIGVGLHSLGATRPRLSMAKAALSRRKSSDFLLEAPHRHRLKSTTRKPPPTTVLSSSSSPTLKERPRPDELVRFAIVDRSKLAAFEFSLDTAAQRGSRRGVKRCRLGSDVEGPNTASVGRKKRRLRSRLITSRLSQPFSQPATHILNREGRQVGDRRFVKMAVMLDSSRRAAYLRATAYLRYSIMNRMRKRMGLQRYYCQASSAKEGHDVDGSGNTVQQGIDTFTRAPWQQSQSQQAVKTAPEARFSFPEARKGAAAAPPAPQEPVQSVETLAKAPACRLSKPIALPLPSADADATNDRTSARIDSTTSPEPRPPLAWMYDDCEEDSFAFLHADEEHLDDDDDDDSGDVYCNFDAIFAAKATSPDPQTPAEEHTYEEYMDELDGISWRIG